MGFYNQGSYIQGFLQRGVLHLGVVRTRVRTARVLRKGGSYIQGLLTYIHTILRGLAFMGVTFRFLMLRGLKFWSLIFRRYDNVFETNEREMETRLNRTIS